MKKNKVIPAAIFAHRGWIELTDPTMLKSRFDVELNEVGFHVLSFTEHYFDNGGYTAVWLLAESHFAIHTFPEEEKSYIELSSCNEEKMLCFRKRNVVVEEA